MVLSLSGAKKLMDDEEFIICILGGLGSEFDPILVTLNAHVTFPLLEGVIRKLRDFGMCILLLQLNNFEMCILAAREASPAVPLYHNHGKNNSGSQGDHGSHGSM